jgi:hypothetical protein
VGSSMSEQATAKSCAEAAKRAQKKKSLLFIYFF